MRGVSLIVRPCGVRLRARSSGSSSGAMMWLARHDAGLRLGRRVEPVDGGGEAGEMLRRIGAEEAAAAFVVTVDRLAPDDVLEQVEPLSAIGNQRTHQLFVRRIVLLRRPAADALADIDPGADRAAVARARPGTEIV